MAEEKKGFFKRLKEGLSKTRNSIVDSFSSVFGASHIDDDFYEELEETFIMADMGYETTEKVIEEPERTCQGGQDQRTCGMQGTDHQYHKRSDDGG